jgi:fatty-acyl-CoA synthase
MRAIDYFDKAAEAYPGRVALIDANIQLAYQDLRSASERVARAMWAAGLRDEDRVALFSPNDARVLVCMLALMRRMGSDQLPQCRGRQRRVHELRGDALALLPQ